MRKNQRGISSIELPFIILFVVLLTLIVTQLNSAVQLKNQLNVASHAMTSIVTSKNVVTGPRMDQTLVGIDGVVDSALAEQLLELVVRQFGSDESIRSRLGLVLEQQKFDVNNQPGTYEIVTAGQTCRGYDPLTNWLSLIGTAPHGDLNGGRPADLLQVTVCLDPISFEEQESTSYFAVIKRYEAEYFMSSSVMNGRQLEN
ncbi:hypothetical protein MHO82_04795 [Vibrio sp. Of7-15]|uniref:tight adherence pilus pseudopilin TadF n=1 Tax=Vibrio sp. Of7-15 TaxID=2724879 RepID=UPI001EF20E69|nr:tight adherence pilus pseudopilin TadF [Vibrio sp. Of7-15]MCG7496168.1 hypothetical protein [Vibrio sp. Of7-15]